MVLPSTTTSTFLPTGETAKKMTFKEMELMLARLRMDFEQQEKQFLDEVDDLNAFDVVLRRAQDKVLF